MVKNALTSGRDIDKCLRLTFLAHPVRPIAVKNTIAKIAQKSVREESNKFF